MGAGGWKAGVVWARWPTMHCREPKNAKAMGAHEAFADDHIYDFRLHRLDRGEEVGPAPELRPGAHRIGPLQRCGDALMLPARTPPAPALRLRPPLPLRCRNSS